MTEGKFEKLGPVLGAIGEQAASDIDGNADGIYIYVEMGDGWYSIYLFRDEGETVRCYDSSGELNSLVRDEWKTEDVDKRWCVMEYEIRDNRFDVHFKFPWQLDIESMDEDRVGTALVKRYGDKPIIYPQIPDEFRELN